MYRLSHRLLARGQPLFAYVGAGSALRLASAIGLLAAVQRHEGNTTARERLIDFVFDELGGARPLIGNH